eukprot:TRINITY_DN14803_c0_g3_i1.p2 TRINITY_DN14803_c0_g3~~TRINITY_DN14803_c0_g3_i1.p2  ORF type:complete len:130 (+),score=5.38 TRINITY_DN14803_c0_g3_i1:225-614(+)
MHSEQLVSWVRKFDPFATCGSAPSRRTRQIWFLETAEPQSGSGDSFLQLRRTASRRHKLQRIFHGPMAPPVIVMMRKLPPSAYQIYRGEECERLKHGGFTLFWLFSVFVCQKTLRVRLVALVVISFLYD